MLLSHLSVLWLTSFPCRLVYAAGPTMEIKCAGTFPVTLVKLPTSAIPSHPKQCWVQNEMSGNESFWDRNIIDGGSGEGIKKWTQSLSKTGSKVTILGGGGGGVHNVPNSFDLHCCRKVSWQRAKMARWQLHASGHGGLLTRSGGENFKHRDLRKMMEYLPWGILKKR